jgi:hypothetical protein
MNSEVSTLLFKRELYKSASDIVAANQAYKSNPVFANIVALTSVVRARRGSVSGAAASPLDNQNLLVETISYMKLRLSDEMYASAMFHFNRIRSSPAGSAQLEGKLYDTFLAQLFAAASDEQTALFKEYKEGGYDDLESASRWAADGGKAIGEGLAGEGETMEELATIVVGEEQSSRAARAGPVTEDAIAALPADRDDADVLPATDEGATDDVYASLQAIAPQGARKRKQIRLISTIGKAVETTAGWILRRFTSMFDGRGQQGGGDKESASKLLVAVYLRKLLFSLRGFEHEGNFDSDYYEMIAMVAISAIKPNRGENNYYPKLQGFFYDVLPKMDFAQMSSVEYRKENLQHVASQIALQSIDRIDGEIASMGNPSLAASEALSEYGLLVKKYGRLPYEQRLDALCNELSDRLISFAAPSMANLARNRLERNRITRKRTNNAAAAATSRLSVGHVLGTGETVHNSWPLNMKRAANNAAKAKRAEAAAARLAESQRWANAAAAAPPAPGRYAEPMRIRVGRGGTKRRARGRASGGRSSTYKARRRYTRRLGRV